MLRHFIKASEVCNIRCRASTHLGDVRTKATMDTSALQTYEHAAVDASPGGSSGWLAALTVRAYLVVGPLSELGQARCQLSRLLWAYQSLAVCKRFL
jgi:hypothetical protein